MENPLKYIGFRQFIIKTTILILLGISVNVFIVTFFKYTPFFNEYLSIPQVFQIEKPNMRTIFLNSLFFGLVGFIIISYNELKNLKTFKFQNKQLLSGLLSIFFLIFHYVFKFIINRNLSYFIQHPTFWGTVKIFINILFIIFLAFAVYGLDFIIYFIKHYKKKIIIFIGISIGFFFLMLAFQNLWYILSSSIGSILFSFFQVFFNDVKYTPFVASNTMIEGGGPNLTLGKFSAIIGKPCSGIDSLLLFTSLYFLIFCLDYQKLKKPLTIGLFFIGAIGMFLTNIIRIFVLFIVGAYWSPKLAVGLFHTNLGWIFFIIYFVLYWWLSSKFIYN